MKLFSTAIKKADIDLIKLTYGEYFKIVIDIKQEILVVGCELHADGAELLLNENNSKDENIWGGAFDLNSKEIYYSAVYNIKPRLKNNAMDILDGDVRDKFGKLTKNFFKNVYYEQ